MNYTSSAPSPQIRQALGVLAAQSPADRQWLIDAALAGNPHGFSPELVALLTAVSGTCRTPAAWRQLRRELAAPPARTAPPPARTGTRPRARRPRRATGSSSSRGDPPGHEDPDPVQAVVDRLTAAAPPLSDTQARQLRALLQDGAR